MRRVRGLVHVLRSQGRDGHSCSSGHLSWKGRAASGHVSQEQGDDSLVLHNADVILLPARCKVTPPTLPSAPCTAVITGVDIRVADQHVREEVRPSTLEPGVGLVHVSQVNAMSSLELVILRVCPGASDACIRRGSGVAPHLYRCRRSRRRAAASERSL